jgi:hypothetical protein
MKTELLLRNATPADALLFLRLGIADTNDLSTDEWCRVCREALLEAAGCRRTEIQGTLEWVERLPAGIKVGMTWWCDGFFIRRDPDGGWVNQDGHPCSAPYHPHGWELR